MTSTSIYLDEPLADARLEYLFGDTEETATATNIMSWWVEQGWAALEESTAYVYEVTEDEVTAALDRYFSR